MDKRQALRSMLNNLINDKPEEASMDLHDYLTGKMKEVAGLSAAGQDAHSQDVEFGGDDDGDDEIGME